jgi:hypothetical protein
MRCRTRPSVEPFEDRIPVAESIGLALALRALADTATLRAVQMSPTPQLHQTNNANPPALGALPSRAVPANGLTDPGTIALHEPAASDFLFAPANDEAMTTPTPVPQLSSFPKSLPLLQLN